jgi:hypothetical protein
MREPHEKFGPALDALIAAQSCRQLAPKADAALTCAAGFIDASTSATPSR